MVGFVIGLMCLVLAAAFVFLAAAEGAALRRAKNFPEEDVYKRQTIYYIKRVRLNKTSITRS